MKEQLSTVGVPNTYKLTNAQLAKIRLARCSDLHRLYESIAKRMKDPFRKELLANIDKADIVSFNSPLVLNVNYKPDRILINVKPLKVVDVYKVNVYIVVASILAGSTFFKRLSFDESVTYSYLKYLLIRIFGKKYGLLVPSRKKVFEQILYEYVYLWRTDAQDFDVFINRLKSLIKIDKSRFIAYSLKYVGVEGLPVFEDYYRLIAYNMGSLVPNKVFRKVVDFSTLLNRIATIWYHAKYAA